MKTKQSFLLILFTFSCMFCKAQTIYKDLYNIFMGTDYIFEGQVIRSDCYYGDNEQMIYTSYTMEISKIFKGELSCGTVEVITEGGTVGDVSLEVSHSISFRKGEIGIFCANLSPYENSAINYYPETNDAVLYIRYGNQGFFKYFFDDINAAISNTRYDFDSLVQVYDTLQIMSQTNYIDCENSPINGFLNEIPTFRTHTNKPQNQSPIHNEPSQTRISVCKERQNQKQAKLKTGSSSKIMANPDSLIYTFENEQFTTDANGNYLEFDIYLRSDVNTYFDNGEVYIQYDTTVFGSFVYNSGSLTVDRGTILADVANYDMPFVIDSAYNYFLVQMVAYNNPPSWYEISPVAEQAIHIKLKTKNCNFEAALSFRSQASMQNFSFWSDGIYIYPFPNIAASDTAHSVLCKSTITDVYPDEIHAGIGDTLYIKGRNLGTSMGNIIMRNANTIGGYVFLNKGVDYQNSMWTDTLIKVVLPALVDSIGAYPGGNTPITIHKDGVVGTGSLAISNQWKGATPLNQAVCYVKVVYGVSQVYDNIDQIKKRVVLVDGQSPPVAPFYTFYTDSLTKSNTPAIAAIFKALEKWSCYTQIKFQLDTSSVIPFPVDSVLNGINTIRLTSKMPKPTVAGETKIKRNLYCNSAGIYIAEEIDITLKDTAIWWYDTMLTDSTGPVGSWDFFEVILHEIGHAYLVQHVRDSTQVLNYNTSNSIRTIDLTTDSSVVAAINVRNFSLSKLPACGWYAPSGYICSPNSISSSSPILPFKLYPNPFSDEIILEMSNNSDKPIIQIWDILGRLVSFQQIDENSIFRIKLPDSATGIYYLSISLNNQSFTTKIIKQ